MAEPRLDPETVNESSLDAVPAQFEKALKLPDVVIEGVLTIIL